MTPSLRKLDVLVGVWIVLGPILLVVGLTLAFSSPGLMPLIGAVCAALGGVLLLGALVGKVAMLAVQSIDEGARSGADESAVAEEKESTR